MFVLSLHRLVVLSLLPLSIPAANVAVLPFITAVAMTEVVLLLAREIHPY